MGKGDKKTRRGKILMGSHGVRRPRKKITRLHPAMVVIEEKPAVLLKEKVPAKTKAVKEETLPKNPEPEAPVAEAVKPEKKKAPTKASAKKTAKPEE
jgi:ribosomal small subunit protein bTHX